MTLADGRPLRPVPGGVDAGACARPLRAGGGGACFTGDAVLGEGSVFISPYPGAMSGYLLALERLRPREDFDVLCPGHGPPGVGRRMPSWTSTSRHRIDRENALIAALGEGRRTVDELLDAVWPEVPEGLRPLAAVTLAAHLDKLDEEECPARRASSAARALRGMSS